MEEKRSSPEPQATTRPAYMDLHDEAVRRGEQMYIDPDTGYTVFTATFFLARGFCCDSSCRHCPYEI